VAVYQRVSELVRPPHVVRQAAVSDVIPPNMALDLASLPPAAIWDAATRVLSWSPVNVPAAGSTLSYQLLPQAAGRWATNVRAGASYVDGWEDRGLVTFPVPEVDVVPPPTASPTATQPATATARPTTPPTTTPSPTAAPRVVQAVYLPRLVLSRCTAVRSPMEVALVLDTSASMGQVLEPGGGTRLAAARSAARALVDQLEPGDRVAVVAFNGQARTVLALTDDPAAALVALDGLTLGQGSRLDLGLAVATAALAERRPGAAAGLVLFSDGRASVDAGTVRAAADAAWSAGITIHSIATGADADAQLLADLSRDAARFHASPRSADMAGIVRDLRPAPSCAEGLAMEDEGSVDAGK
jgi:Mg-chelatase subunit ChlD